MKSLIGKTARRVTFTLFKDGVYHLLFSVIEELYPDFQDLNDYRDKFVCRRINHTDKRCVEKIYFSIDFLEITKDLLTDPTKDFVLQDSNHTSVVCNGTFKSSPIAADCKWIISHHSSPDILKVLPERNDTRYIKVWESQSFVIQSTVLSNPLLLHQLRELSVKHYGVDLTCYTGVLGKVYLVGYNPYYRSLDISLSDKPAGIYIEVKGARQIDKKLSVSFVNKNKGGWYEYSVDYELDLSRRNHLFSLPDTPERVEIIVKDKDNKLIDVIPPLSFVKAVQVNMNIASSRLAITHGDNTKEDVQKYDRVHFEVAAKSRSNVYSGRTDIISLISPEAAYEILEQGLEFVFFDGSKDQTEKARNKEKAREIVKKILSRANQNCMIADPYFNLNDLTHFVFTLSQSEVVVRILGSVQFLKSNSNVVYDIEEERKHIRKAIAEYMDKYPNFNVQFRVLTGKCPLHDRYLVVDDDVWLVGTSFNEIGGRASTIIKLPKDSGNRVRRELETWWSNNSQSISV